MSDEIYVNRLQPLETVKIVGFDKKEIFKEVVTIVKYEILTSTIGTTITSLRNRETTEENFHSKYLTRIELREEKLNDLGI